MLVHAYASTHAHTLMLPHSPAHVHTCGAGVASEGRTAFLPLRVAHLCVHICCVYSLSVLILLMLMHTSMYLSMRITYACLYMLGCVCVCACILFVCVSMSVCVPCEHRLFPYLRASSTEGFRSTVSLAPTGTGIPQPRAKGKKVGGKSRHVTLAACQEGRCQHFTTSNYASHEEETSKVSKVQTDYLLEGKDP